ncbi:hypothetical protein JQS43_20885 [Natronosporangium hydrolyticum]|uniref:Flavoprotein domain-containing protein n=1 Tax=Natronosporangium hydrolyticum TaxID=2811111 RepID=A0A895YIM5_9ACTN|nr:flavoprotein [Natronosporangium hydrolyticum]QSB13970.1 hypothetical protein JQS43_20885 [Natronosporangium hydrolyticum]
MTGPAPAPRVLVGATGSIAVSSLPSYLGALRERIGGSYTVLMTHTATQFIPPQTVGLAADRVVAGEATEDWPTDRPSRLAADHDLLLVLPATANILAAAAAGAAPNRLATVILAVPYPAVFFPHMGTPMWRKPALQRNVAQLRADGHQVVEPVWHDSYDVAAQTMVSHPAIPSPEEVVTVVEKLLAE